MTTINASNYIIAFQENGYKELNTLIQKNSYSKLFLLTDSNTNPNCSTFFLRKIQFDKTIEILEITSGEEYKNIETCLSLWETLVVLEADKSALLINLGGGVLTDIGGFIATTFMRGFDFVHVPTTLLAMVDASVGGKNGVDLGNLKNQIGTINTPKMVLIDTDFLATLPAKEMRNGLAEMLKHGLIADANYYKRLTDLENLDLTDLDELIHESILIKHTITSQDPFEKGMRKKLNFGHTLGHAIETYAMQTENPLAHGESVAIGMILALYLSTKRENFSKKIADSIKNQLLKTFSKIEFSKEAINQILILLKHDKKNKNGKLNFVLLKEIGDASINHHFKNRILLEAFDYYQQ